MTAQIPRTQTSPTLNRRAMLPIFAIAAVDAIGMGIVMPLLPFYTTSFGATPLVLGLLVALFSACQFIAGPILGRLSDRFGRKPVLIVSQIGTMISFGLLAVSGSLWMVFVARALDGLTSGNMSVVSAAAIDHSTPATRRQAIGVVSAAIGVGIMIGPALPAVLHGLGPQAAMWLAAGMSGASILLTLLFLPADQKSMADQKAIAGQAKPKPAMGALLGNPKTLAVMAVLGLFYLAMAMYVGQIALFAQDRISIGGHPFGLREIGYAFSAVGATNIFVQLFAMRRIGRLFTEAQLVFLSLGLMAAGYSVLSVAHGPIGFAATILLTAFGTAMARPTLISAASLTVAQNQQGAIMGVNQSLMAAMNMIGPIAAGAMISAGLHTVWALTLAALVICAMALAAWLFARNLWPSVANAAAVPTT